MLRLIALLIHDGSALFFMLRYDNGMKMNMNTTSLACVNDTMAFYLWVGGYTTTTTIRKYDTNSRLLQSLSCSSSILHIILQLRLYIKRNYRSPLVVVVLEVCMVHVI